MARETFDSNLAAAVQAHQRGRFAEAERLYRSVLSRRPNEGLALTNLGVLFEQTGRPESALECYQRAIAAHPDDWTRHRTLGVLLMGLGRVDQAIESFRAAVDLSKAAPAYHFLGRALLQRGDLTEAIDTLHLVRQIDPGYLEVLEDLGRGHLLLGRLEEAAEILRQETKVRPNSGVAWLNLGDALAGLGQSSEAVKALQQGLRRSPNDAAGRLALGELFIAMGDLDQAGQQIDAVLRKSPDHPRGLFDQATIHQLRKKNDDAVRIYRRIIKSDPTRHEARLNLASILADQGFSEEASQLYRQIQGPLRPAAAIREALVMPAVADSNASIDAARQRLQQRLEELREERIDDPLRQIGVPGFYLAYQGRNNRELSIEIARFLQTVTPDLAWSAPQIKPRTSGKIVVGFLSVHLREHTVGRINKGLIEHLDRERFEVVVLRPPGIRDEYADEIDRHADRVVMLPASLPSARESVAAQSLDVLYFPDIGMDAFTYYLAFARLARVQCVGWGHAETTGIPNVDAFITCRPFEAPGAETRYSETVVELERINNFFERPAPDFDKFERAELGLPENGPLYLCPQSAFKLHPDFDAVLDAILIRDPAAVVAISAGAESHWDDLLKARFARTIPERKDRISIIPRVAPAKFRGLLALADVILDPIHFTGGHTSYMAFSVGTPVVTWDGAHLRSRMTAGLYEMMGVAGPVAKDLGEFVEFAYELANDAVRHAALSNEIVEKRDRIFEDLEAVRQFETALVELAASR